MSERDPAARPQITSGGRSLPSPSRGVDRGTVDYSLKRRAILREYREGLKSRLDICDAHPELMRAARYVGTEVGESCPVCETGRLRRVAYVYGDGLRRHQANGRCITRADELEKLGTLVDEFTCYEVEVCTGCSWNHLSRSYLLGRRVSAG